MAPKWLLTFLEALQAFFYLEEAWRPHGDLLE